MVSTWKKKKGKTSKFVDAEGNNWNEREGGINNIEWIDSSRMEKENKTLGTERYENIDTLYINE